MNRIDFAKLLASRNFKKGAEIGVADGRYSEILCQQIPNLKLICVDPFYRKGHHEKAVERLKDYDVTIIRKTSMDALYSVYNGREQIDELDFVFIDGNHKFDFVMEDIINWSRLVKMGGIVSGHDYYHFHNSGVVEAVNTYTQFHKINLNLTQWDHSGHADDRCPSWWFVK